MLTRTSGSAVRRLVLLSIFLTACQPAPTPVVATQIVESAGETKYIVVTAEPSPTPIPSETPTAAPLPVLPPVRTPQVLPALSGSGVAQARILHWNDFHGELVERSTEEGTWVPGAARLAAFLQSAAAGMDPGQVLRLDAGDWFEGSPESKQSTGPAKVLELYHRLGVDAITVGNHDFFLGLSRFTWMASQADPIQILSANYRQKKDLDALVISPYQVYDLGAPQGPRLRVAVIGISIENLEQLTNRSPVAGIRFIDPAGEVLKVYDTLRQNEHPDVLILLSHSGIDEDRRLAEVLNAAGKPVDIIIGGHSHTWIDAPEKVGNTTIVTAGELGRAVGVLDLAYDRATKKLDLQWRQEIFSPCSPQDPDTLAFLKDIPAETPSVRPECPPARDPGKEYLIDRTPEQQSVGYWTLGKGIFPAADTGMIENQVITSHGKTYPFGLFAHAPSTLRYALDGQFKSFGTEIGIKETACGDGATFLVSLDGRELYRSKVMLAADEPIPLSLDVTGGNLLTLSTLTGVRDDCDWTIWGDPYLVR